MEQSWIVDVQRVIAERAAAEAASSRAEGEVKEDGQGARSVQWTEKDQQRLVEAEAVSATQLHVNIHDAAAALGSYSFSDHNPARSVRHIFFLSRSQA